MHLCWEIFFELKGRTEEEQEDIYNFVKQLLWFRDKIEWEGAQTGSYVPVYAFLLLMVTII